MWSVVTGLFLVAGLNIARKRAPEIHELRQTDNPFDLVTWLGGAEQDEVHLYFRRPKENQMSRDAEQARVYVSFYSPRQGIPAKLAENHFRFPFTVQDVFKNMCTFIDLALYELPHKQLTVHLGWPMSSWLDRFSIGVLVMNMMRLPKQYPQVTFRIEYERKNAPPPENTPTA
jgi:hypothetical protein